MMIIKEIFAMGLLPTAAVAAPVLGVSLILFKDTLDKGLRKFHLYRLMKGAPTADGWDAFVTERMREKIEEDRVLAQRASQIRLSEKA